MIPQEPRHDRQDVHAAEDDWGSDHETAARFRALAPDAARRIVELLQRRLTRFEVGCSFLGEAHRPRRAQEERRAQFVFEQGYGAAGGRGGKAKLASRRRKAAEPSTVAKVRSASKRSIDCPVR